MLSTMSLCKSSLRWSCKLRLNTVLNLWRVSCDQQFSYQDEVDPWVDGFFRHRVQLATDIGCHMCSAILQDALLCRRSAEIQARAGVISSTSRYR